jgi:glucose-6-phosphate 1-epimerase
VIHDGALNRGIEVVHHHHSNVVGWNPALRSISMADPR